MIFTILISNLKRKNKKEKTRNVYKNACKATIAKITKFTRF